MTRIFPVLAFCSAVLLAGPATLQISGQAVAGMSADQRAAYEAESRERLDRMSSELSGTTPETPAYENAQQALGEAEKDWKALKGASNEEWQAFKESFEDSWAKFERRYEEMTQGD